MPDKEAIRKQIIEKRMMLSQHTLNRAAESAAKKLSQMEEYKNSKVVMLYMDFRKEVPTRDIIRLIRDDGKRLVLPYTDQNFDIIPFEIPEDKTLADCLLLSSFGILEPNQEICPRINPEEIDLVIIPGGAFDQYENRIGWGKGCYDKFLPTLPGKAIRIGLAYDFQVLPCIPNDPTDARMDKILTIATT